MSNSWDGVPWAIGGGQAEHSANLARNVAFAAFGGLEGVVGPADLEVRELDVPGPSIRVYPGTVAIKNRSDGARDEMYVGRLPILDTTGIVATDSSGGRSDLVVALVKDPYLPGSPWTAPANTAQGPYIETFVIQGVPPTTTTVAELGLGYSGYALARIDIPPSTGTISQAMITDLRRLSQSQSQRNLNLIGPTATEVMTTAGFTNWPNQANSVVDIPEWATHVKVLAVLGGIAHGAAGDNSGNGWNVAGDLRIQIGTNAGDNNYSQETRYNTFVSAGVDRTTLMCGAPLMAIPKSLRGKSGVGIRIEARKTGGNTSLTSDALSMVSIDTEFVNRAESNA